MKIAVTGATGFIGKTLVNKCLSNGYEVNVLSRKDIDDDFFDKPVKAFKGDLIEETSILNEFLMGVDILYHCAAEIYDSALIEKVNIDGTNNLIEACKGKKLKWVQLSSTGVYGHPIIGIITEESKENPKGLYEVSKLRADRIIEEAGDKNNLNYVIVRPSNVFGAQMTNQSLFQLIKSVDNNKFIRIGKRNAVANYIHVDNVIESLLICGLDDSTSYKTFIISDYCKMDIFVSYIAEALKKKIPVYRIPKSLMIILVIIIKRIIPSFPLTKNRVKALTSSCIFSSSLILNTTKFSYIVNIEEGLNELVSEYKRRLEL